ncbi:MAG: TIM-barrel domain-containing protein [Bacillota bacterium]
MEQLPDRFHLSLLPQANVDAVVQGINYRFTVLTSQLIRMEYSETGDFEDRASQIFWHRKLPTPDFEVEEKEDTLIIETEHLYLEYQIKAESFNNQSLQIKVKNLNEDWYFGKENSENLKGTIRTLDNIDGGTELEQGLISRAGWSVVDDSQSLVFNSQTGWIEPRELGDNYQDFYFFGYGHQYLQCIQDFTKISGEIPLLPKWALGNWWSRYWDYSQQELKELVNNFKAQGIPLSVCVIDMDWHIVDNQYTKGWTGYTWNKNLFPNPEELIDFLHQNQLKTTLNLHPADGVYPHEKQYNDFARQMGIEVESEEAVEFDITNIEFINNYFELLHHPLEEMGIDFWWIDWQQGTETKIEGLDPLWALNHLHFYDRGKDNRRPFILSRWSGLGSHRYPIGFSGDTIISWESLQFQPYFTATASNVAYSWWSHDIGGHCEGQDEEELYTRWVQFGVFSPIMRLHSTKEKYLDRRPWTKSKGVSSIVKENMRLRHSLIPYLYSMSWRNYNQGIPLIRPMYYYHSEQEEAYNFTSQYYFGSELLAAPHMKPLNESTNLSRKPIWLPEGDWINFFTGEYYRGDNCYVEYGKLEDIPVFAKAGAIVPLGPKAPWGGVANTKELDVYVFAGADSKFELYEDAGAKVDYCEGEFGITKFIQTWAEDQLQFEISSVTGNKDVVPENRDYELFFRGVKRPNRVDVSVDGQLQEIGFSYDQKKETAIVYIPRVHPSNQVTVNLFAESGTLLSRRDRTQNKCTKLLKSFKMKTRAKAQIEKRIIADKKREDINLLKDFLTVLTTAQIRAIVETFYGVGVSKIKTDEEKKIIAWNNEKRTSFKYHFSSWNQDSPNSNEAIISQFKVFKPQNKNDNKWQLKFDYCDLFNIIYNEIDF